MFDVYFESDIQNVEISFYVILAATILVLVLSPLLKKFYEEKFKTERKINFWIVFIAIFGFLIMHVLSKYESFVRANKIDSGEFSVVEGTIEELQIIEGNSREESFKVSGAYFQYNDYTTPSLFFANREHDSEAIKEGRRVKISYLNVGSENLIFEIKIAK